MAGIYLIIYWRLFITVYYYKWCHNEESFTYIIMYMCVYIKLILKRGIAGSMFYEFKNFDVSTKRLSEEALPVYSPITDEWESSIPHIVQVHYCQLGPQKITHVCLGLHFPITGKVHRLSMVWACVFHTVSVQVVWQFPYCGACLLYALHIFSIVVFHLPNILTLFSQSVLVF